MRVDSGQLEPPPSPPAASPEVASFLEWTRLWGYTPPPDSAPGFRLHPLQGQAAGRWLIWVNGNWRVTFDFREGDVFILDYEDYH